MLDKKLKSPEKDKPKRMLRPDTFIDERGNDDWTDKDFEKIPYPPGHPKHSEGGKPADKA